MVPPQLQAAHPSLLLNCRSRAPLKDFGLVAGDAGLLVSEGAPSGDGQPSTSADSDPLIAGTPTSVLHAGPLKDFGLVVVDVGLMESEGALSGDG